MTDIARLAVEVRTGDVSRARKELDGLTAAGSRAERATTQLTAASNTLGRAVGGVVAALGVRQVLAYADGYQTANARLQSFTNSTAQFNTVQRELIALSERQRVAFTDSADLYIKTAAAAGELGASEQDILKFTEGVGAALTLAGTGGPAASGALIQLSQAIGGANIQAQEFNSLIDGALPLLVAVANNISAAGGSVGRLRQLVIDGQISSREFFAAAVQGSDELVAAAARIPTTFRQALTIAESRLQIFIGQQNEASGATRILVGAVDTLSRNIDTLAAAAIGFGAAKLAQAILSTVAAARLSVAASFEQVAANRAQAAAAIAVAQSEVNLALATRASAAASLQAALAREAELRASALAATGNVQLAITQNGLIPAIARTTAAKNADIAATVALTAAQRGLAGATTAAAVASSLATRALGLLGGPIGAITTVLGLGVTAWALWGSAAENAEDKAGGAVRESTDDIVADLERQIAKLNQRNALISAGAPELARSSGSASERLGELQLEINRLSSQTAEAGSAAEITRQAVLQSTIKEYVRVAGAVQRLADEQAKFDGNANASRASDFLKRYATDAEKLQQALAEAKTELGALFTPEIERRIRASFTRSGQASPFADEIKALRERAVLLGQDTELQRVNAQIQLGRFGSLRPAQEQELRLLASSVDARQEQVDALRAEEQARDAATAAITRAAQQQGQELQALQDGNRALREEIELIGADEQMQAAIAIARTRSTRTLKEERLARLEASGVAEEQLQVLQAEIEALTEREQLLNQRSFASTRATAEEEAKRAGDAYQSNLGQSIEQGILDGFRAGRDLTDIFLDELKAQFARTVLRPLIQPVADAQNQLISSLIGAAVGAFTGGGVPSGDGSGATGDFARFDRSYGGPLETGTNRIKEDALYMLHKDEAVVPARYNPAVGGGGAISAPKVTLNIIGGQQQPSSVQQRQDSSGNVTLDVIYEQFVNRLNSDTSNGYGVAPSLRGRFGASGAEGLKF